MLREEGAQAETERDKWNLGNAVIDDRFVSEATTHGVYTQFILFPMGKFKL